MPKPKQSLLELYLETFARREMIDPNAECEVRTLHIGLPATEGETQLINQDGWEVGLINHFPHHEIAERICRRYNAFERLEKALRELAQYVKDENAASHPLYQRAVEAEAALAQNSVVTKCKGCGFDISEYAAGETMCGACRDERTKFKSNAELQMRLLELCESIQLLCLGSIEWAVQDAAGRALIASWNDDTPENPIDEVAELNDWIETNVQTNTPKGTP